MSCGCGGSRVASRTRTVWGAKSTMVGQFVPFFEGKAADVKALKVDALVEEGCNYGSFEVMVKVSQDGLTYSGDDVVLTGSTEGWHYGDGYHSMRRDYRYWQLGVYFKNATTNNAGSARIELVLSKSATMDLKLGTRGDDQVVRWDGTTGLQGSQVSIDDSGNLSMPSSGQVQFGSASAYVSGVSAGDLTLYALEDLSITADDGIDLVSAGVCEINAGSDISLDSGDDVFIRLNGSVYARFDGGLEGLLLLDGGTTWATFDGSKRSTILRDNATGASEIVTAIFTNDSTVDSNQFYYACHDSTGIVGGLCGTGGGTGLLLQSTGGNMEIEANGGGNLELNHGSGTAVSINSSRRLRVTPGSTATMEVVKNTSSTTLDYVPFRGINEVSSGTARVAYFQFSGVAIPGGSNWYVAFRDSGGGADGRIAGTGSGGVSYVTSSDSSLKRSIQPARHIEGKALSILRRVRNRQWQHVDNTDPDAPVGYGWVAQELAEDFPEAAVPPDPSLPDDHVDATWGVEPLQFIPLLVEGMKELDAEHDRRHEAQNARISELEARIGALEARLNA